MTLVTILMVFVGLIFVVNSRSNPPPAIPEDGHDATLVLATGSVIAVPTQVEADLLGSVAQFHISLNGGNPNGVSSQTCLTCHSNINSLESVLQKMPNEDGTIEILERPNHHKTHSSKPYLNFGDECTFCHNEFDIAQQDGQVTIASYVEKTTCAGCHSRFSPRGLMLESYIAEDGCPGCHAESWEPLHTLSPTYSSVIVPDKIKLSEQACLTCHGENKNKIPEFLQDIFWEYRTNL